MTSRRVRISSHYAVAELAAFPFVSESSFEIGICEIDCLFRADDARDLWRAAERHILGSIPSMSIDEFVAQRDKLWLGQNEREGSIRLLDILRIVARTVLGRNGAPRLSDGEFVGHGRHGEQHARALWKWLKLSMPTELLLAGSECDGSAQASLLSPGLEGRLRDGGFAEMHLHVGAALDFAQFWSLSCRRLLEADSSHRQFQSPGAEFNDGKELGGWFLRACVVRYVLCAFLFRPNDDQTLSEYLNWRTLADNAVMKHLGAVRISSLLEAVEEVRQGKFLRTDPEATFHDIRQVLIGMRESQCDGFEEMKDRGDPIDDWFAHSLLVEDSSRCRYIDIDKLLGAADTEIRFLRQAFDYLDGNHGDDLFQQLFWQSTRVRCAVFRHVVQRPLTPGLIWFVRTFSRMKAGKGDPGLWIMTNLAALTSGEGRGLKSLEIRTAPGDDVAQNLEMLNEIGSSGAQAMVGEIGLVLHFTRDRGGGTREGAPSGHGRGSNADPEAEHGAHGARFGRWYREQRVRAYALASMIRSFPSTLELLRGLDVCTDEIGVPTWVVKPLISYVRDVATAAAQQRAKLTGGPPHCLRMTAHVGEDWPHLLGGLRRIQEAMEHFEMEAGDRLGHGLALGVDASRWARDAGPVPMSIEERLFDLVWAWRRTSELRLNCPIALESEIRRCLDEIFDGVTKHYDVWDAVRFVESLHEVEVLRRLHYPDVSLDRESMVARYLVDGRVFRRGRRIIHVDPNQEADLLISLQQELHREVGRRGLVVEVNPSSNFLTSQLASLQEHPAWRLRSPRGDSELPRIAVVIGSDDPLTFATTLPEEYQLMHDALVLEGLTTEEADQWIEDARHNGMIHRWTRPSQGRRQGRREQCGEVVQSFEYGHTYDDVPLPP